MGRTAKDRRQIKGPRKLADGRKAYDVYFRDEFGKQRQITKYSLEDAERLRDDIRWGTPNDDLLPDTTLGQFFSMEEVQDEIKRANKIGPKTAENWLGVWKRHICHEDYGIAGVPVKQMSKKAPHSAFLIAMSKAGVGEATQRRALGIVSAILDEAVERDLMESNPIPGMKGKPDASRKKKIYIPSIETIELLRKEIMAHPNGLRRSEYAQRDALMISLMAYEAPRPEEVRGLNWDDILWSDEQIFIYAEKAKRGKARIEERHPPLNEVVAEELGAWYTTLGQPGGHTPVIPLPKWGKRRAGEHWTGENWKDWRHRVFKPALKRVADQVARNKDEHDQICGMRPYDLRHNAISTWLANGGTDANGELDGSPANPVDVASWAGHDLRTMHEIYAHRTRNKARVPIAQQIRDARQKHQVA